MAITAKYWPHNINRIFLNVRNNFFSVSHAIHTPIVKMFYLNTDLLIIRRNERHHVFVLEFKIYPFACGIVAWYSQTSNSSKTAFSRKLLMKTTCWDPADSKQSNHVPVLWSVVHKNCFCITSYYPCPKILIMIQ